MNSSLLLAFYIGAAIATKLQIFFEDGRTFEFLQDLKGQGEVLGYFSLVTFEEFLKLPPEGSSLQDFFTNQIKPENSPFLPILKKRSFKSERTPQGLWSKEDEEAYNLKGFLLTKKQIKRQLAMRSERRSALNFRCLLVYLSNIKSLADIKIGLAGPFEMTLAQFKAQSCPLSNLIVQNLNDIEQLLLEFQASCSGKVIKKNMDEVIVVVKDRFDGKSSFRVLVPALYKADISALLADFRLWRKELLKERNISSFPFDSPVSVQHECDCQVEEIIAAETEQGSYWQNVNFEDLTFNPKLFDEMLELFSEPVPSTAIKRPHNDISGENNEIPTSYLDNLFTYPFESGHSIAEAQEYLSLFVHGDCDEIAKISDEEPQAKMQKVNE